MSSGYASSSDRSLPLGVAILAVLIGVVGFVFLIAGLIVLAVALVVGLSVPTFGLAAFGTGLLGGLILTIFAIVLLAVAFGLWDTELWALVLSIIVVVLLLVGYALRGDLISLGGLILVILLIYLIAVNQHFR
jgi:hypothetical protein